MAAARRGDPTARRELLQRYRPRVLRLATHVLHRRDDAEDAAQEALIRALSRLDDFRGESPFSHWILRIASRACIDFARRRVSRREVALSNWDEPGHAETSAGIDTRVLVSALLTELAPPLRAALVLREMEGLSYEEVAEVLAVPVGTVRSRLSAARSRFRSLYEAALEEARHV